MFLGCGNCGLSGVQTIPPVDPKVQQMVIYGAVALVVLGVGIYFLARR